MHEVITLNDFFGGRPGPRDGISDNGRSPGYICKLYPKMYESDITKFQKSGVGVVPTAYPYALATFVFMNNTILLMSRMNHFVRISVGKGTLFVVVPWQ